MRAVDMALDETVLVKCQCLPVGELFDQLRGQVDSGFDCVDTPEKTVEISSTYDKDIKADQMLSHLSQAQIGRHA